MNSDCFRDGLISIVTAGINEARTAASTAGQANPKPPLQLSDRSWHALSLLTLELESADGSAALPSSLTAIAFGLQQLFESGYCAVGTILHRLSPTSHAFWLTAFRYRVGRETPSDDVIARCPPTTILLLEILETLHEKERTDRKADVAFGGGRLMLFSYLCDRLRTAQRTEGFFPPEIEDRIYFRLVAALNDNKSDWRGFLDQAYVDAARLLPEDRRLALRKLQLLASTSGNRSRIKWASAINGLS